MHTRKEPHAWIHLYASRSVMQSTSVSIHWARVKGTVPDLTASGTLFSQGLGPQGQTLGIGSRTQNRCADALKRSRADRDLLHLLTPYKPKIQPKLPCALP